MIRMFKISIAALALIGASTAALAQRDPAYQGARTAGQIGEQPDGYLGVVGTESAELRAMINNINIQRKAAYTQQSAQSGSTVDQFAVTSGCNLIARTVPGEKYKAPDGSWKTRTSAPPERIASCI